MRVVKQALLHTFIIEIKVCAKRVKWPTVTLKWIGAYDDAERVNLCQRLRRWPNGVWCLNDPKLLYGSLALLPRPQPYGGLVSQAEIEEAYSAYLSRRILKSP